MSYKSLNTHTEKYLINHTLYTVAVDFFKDVIFVSWGAGCRAKFSLDQYENFTGDMRDFVEKKVANYES